MFISWKCRFVKAVRVILHLIQLHDKLKLLKETTNSFKYQRHPLRNSCFSYDPLPAVLVLKSRVLNITNYNKKVAGETPDMWR